MEKRKSRAANLSGDGEVFELVGAHELVALHSDSYFVGAFRFGAATAKNFSEATDADGRGTAGEGDDVFDFAANIDIIAGEEADAAGTDVARVFCAIYAPISQLQYVQRKLQFISLCATLFQVTTVRLL